MGAVLYPAQANITCGFFFGSKSIFFRVLASCHDVPSCPPEQVSARKRKSVCSCNKTKSHGGHRTKARVAWNVVLYCSNRASICSLAFILLSPSRVFVMTGWRTSISLQPFAQTRLDYGSLLYSSISFHPVFQNPRVSNTFELWILVCVHASVSSLVFISLQLCQTPVPCSNTFGLWLLVCVHASVSRLVFQTRLDCGLLFVYKHQSPALCFKHV